MNVIIAPTSPATLRERALDEQRSRQFQSGWDYGERMDARNAAKAEQEQQKAEQEQQTLRQRALAQANMEADLSSKIGRGLTPEESQSVARLSSGDVSVLGQQPNAQGGYEQGALSALFGQIGQRSAKDYESEKTAKKLGIEKTRAEINRLNSASGGHGMGGPRDAFFLQKEIGERRKNEQDVASDKLFGGPIQKKTALDQVGKLADKNAQLFNIKSGIEATVSALDDPNLSEDLKIVQGMNALKILNSAEGSDAVGVEESKRLGSLLEFKIANLTGPGSFVGRDLGLFTEQLKNKSKELGTRAEKNQYIIEGLQKGKNIADLTREAAMIGVQPAMALQPVQEKAAFAPTKGQGAGEVQAAKAPMAEYHPEANQAVHWAQSNPRDPRAVEIMRRFSGGK